MRIFRKGKKRVDFSSDNSLRIFCHDLSCLLWHTLKGENKSNAFKNVEKPKTKVAWPWRTALSLHLSESESLGLLWQHVFLYIRSKIPWPIWMSDSPTSEEHYALLCHSAFDPDRQNCNLNLDWRWTSICSTLNVTDKNRLLWESKFCSVIPWQSFDISL